MNILLITAFFYPQNRIPVLRIGQWAKYWARGGHNVTVITPKKYSFLGPLGLDEVLPTTIEIIEIDFLPECILSLSSKSDFKKTPTKINSKPNQNRLKILARSFRSLMGSYLDIHDLWIHSGTKICLELTRTRKYDLIISSYSPPATHIIASNIKKKNPSIRWVADFRDLWAYNHLQNAKSIFGFFEKNKEKRIIADADVITTVSKELTEEMQHHYPNKKIETIENGFDPDEFPNWHQQITERKPFNGILKITYAGTIYSGKRDPTPLFEACNDLIDENIIKRHQIAINFFGNSAAELSKIINHNNYNKHEIININGHVSREVSLSEQKNSNLLLFLEWNDPSAKGILTGKLFEYLVSGTPMLAIGVNKNTASGALIEKTGTGTCAITKEEVKNIIKNIIIKNSYYFYNPNSKEIEKYQRNQQAHKIIAL